MARQCRFTGMTERISEHCLLEYEQYLEVLNLVAERRNTHTFGLEG